VGVGIGSGVGAGLLPPRKLGIGRLHALRLSIRSAASKTEKILFLMNRYPPFCAAETG
jgi:hypothetical protein